MPDAPVNVNPPADPQSHVGFDAQPPVAVVEVDRFCGGCGYNLRHSQIRRDPATRLLLCRCPECGAYHPANELAATTRAWAKHLLVGVAILWVFFWWGVVGMAMVGWGGTVAVGQELAVGWDQVEVQVPMAFDANGNPTHWQANIQYQQVLRGWDTERTTVTALMAVAVSGIGMLLMTLIVSAFAHWRRWGYVLLATLWFAVPAGILAVGMILRAAYGYGYNQSISAVDAGRIEDWNWMWWFCCIVLGLAGALPAVWLGRSIARLAVRIFVPRTWRVGLSYLWLVDGKTLPNMDPLGSGD